jgi:hypothetical protein
LQIAFCVKFGDVQKIHEETSLKMFSASGWISLTTGESFSRSR